jgi:hypothetical protein
LHHTDGQSLSTRLTRPTKIPERKSIFTAYYNRGYCGYPLAWFIQRVLFQTKIRVARAKKTQLKRVKIRLHGIGESQSSALDFAFSGMPSTRLPPSECPIDCNSKPMTTSYEACDARRSGPSAFDHASSIPFDTGMPNLKTPLRPSFFSLKALPIFSNSSKTYEYLQAKRWQSH